MHSILPLGVVTRVMLITMLMHSITTLTNYHPAAGSMIARHIIACSTVGFKVMLVSMQIPSRCVKSLWFVVKLFAGIKKFDVNLFLLLDLL